MVMEWRTHANEPLKMLRHLHEPEFQLLLLPVRQEEHPHDGPLVAEHLEAPQQVAVLVVSPLGVSAAVLQLQALVSESTGNS